uniref:Uncharacterized protein n=1 Tax=Ditylenchus dipsaci TaxID=166011 RepID=A0A915DFA2_9BILA
MTGRVNGMDQTMRFCCSCRRWRDELKTTTALDSGTGGDAGVELWRGLPQAGQAWTTTTDDHHTSSQQHPIRHNETGGEAGMTTGAELGTGDRLLEPWLHRWTLRRIAAAFHWRHQLGRQGFNAGAGIMLSGLGSTNHQLGMIALAFRVIVRTGGSVSLLCWTYMPTRHLLLSWHHHLTA